MLCNMQHRDLCHDAEKKRRNYIQLISHLCYRSVEAEQSLRIIGLFQLLQTALSPALTPIPLLRTFIAKSIIDISWHVLTSRSLVEDLADLVAHLRGPVVQLSTIRLVSDQWTDEDVLVSVGKSGAFGINRLDALGGVTIKSDQRVVEDGVATDVLSEKVKGFLLCGGVECLEVDGEPRVHGSILLTRTVFRGDADPLGKICVKTLLCVNREGLQFVEGGTVCLVDGLDAFLDQEDLDNGLL